MPTLPFTVDSALLRELGERLVGKPYIALAELVKNSYDADATNLIIELNAIENQITISDNGHGMDFSEFKDYWMRIGSPHKDRLKRSRKFSRKFTGSKGVGRLAVQYLAEELELITISDKNIKSQLISKINWSEAVTTKDLTSTRVFYEIKECENELPGTKLILKKLKQDWDIDLVQGLAKEIWWLQPPFRTSDPSENKLEKTFVIEFKSTEKEFEKKFNTEIKSILTIWYAKIVGKSIDENVTISLEFKGEDSITEQFILQNNKLKECNFEIRFYYLTGRQSHGIKVGEARKYFDEFGGVHVYDGGFHLPYYGNPRNDWLQVEYDHAHRLSISKYLPEQYQMDRGLQFLPTTSRMFGVVNVDTSNEPDLNILITRDRLQQTEPFENLKHIVRYAIDFYAYQEKLKNIKSKEVLKKIVTPKQTRLDEVIETYKEEIPERTFRNLKKDIQIQSAEIETEAEAVAQHVGFMGSLATAGISSLAIQHETKWQIKTLERVVIELSDIESKITDRTIKRQLTKIKKDINEWIEKSQTISKLFSYFGSTENIENRTRFPARKVLEEVKNQVKVLSRNIPIDLSEVEYILLPEASLIEWSAIFQNVFNNAFNAMIESDKKEIKVSLKENKPYRIISIQDTGVGVDLDSAETLFDPFVRKIKISPERQALGYGGMGLGLTIVRLIARNIGCEVSFIKPEKGYSTAFSLRWREQ